MPLSLKSKHIAPRDGYKWTDPTGFTVGPCRNWDHFMGQVKERKIQIGESVGAEWEMDLQDYVCRQNSNIPCQDKTRPERHLNWSDFEEFFYVLCRAVARGVTLVPQEEAERRAAICAGCPMNQSLGGFCSACTDILGRFVKLVSGHTTSQDASLHNCAVCSCRLVAAVHVPLEVQRDDRFTKADFTDRNPACWKAELL
jgi:hypothetical protein